MIHFELLCGNYGETGGSIFFINDFCGVFWHSGKNLMSMRVVL